MNRVILADNQAIFRAGAARVLALDDDMRIVAQCEDLQKMVSAIEAYPGAVVLFSASLVTEVDALAAQARQNRSRIIMVAENGAQLSGAVLRLLDGVVYRNVPGSELLDCIRRVGSGQRCLLPADAPAAEAKDSAGARVRDRLTPKEMQIVALIVQGCKNKHIATQLNTKEQVIKNYLRSIYDKTGVSDRLELALFTIHHRVLADAAAQAGDLLQASGV